MATRISAYADSAAFVALSDRSDTHHALFDQLFSDPPVVYTTVLVIAESHGWFLRRFDSNRALQFLNLVNTMKFLRVLSAGAAELTAATQYLRRFSDQNLTLTDALGLYYMKELRVTECWSTDRHMALTGMKLVIH